MKLDSNVILPQPDPFVCPVEGGWAMYATGKDGIGAYFCDTPFGKWEYRGIVLKMEGYHEYWAPCMYYEDGWYYLYFSCMPIGAQVQEEHLRVAKAPTPFGPFGDVKCLYDYFSIDAHVVKTDAGFYLWYAKDNTDCERVGTRIVVDKMLDPVTPAGSPLEKVIPSFDEEIYKRDRYKAGQHWHTIEGPFWLQVGDWQYVMYSGACFENDTYHIGYASAKTTEPDLTKVTYQKHTDHGKFVPLMTKNDAEEGVGHHSVIFYDGQYYAIYHARDYSPAPQLTVEQRTARICKLHFNDGIITAERM